ncbi:MAG: SPFH domain-containing protein, partial [Cyanobacteria bacterium J06631_2]
IECSNFEDAQAFIRNGGYRGKQLQVLTAGKYVINTELFRIKRVDPVAIAANEVGLIEAKDGQPLPLGQNFGKVVECNNFQDAQAFLRNGGQQGKQLAIIPPGIYNINTELFQVRKVPVVNIPSGEIGLILAQDGAARSSEQILSKTVESYNFQDAQGFIRNGGQKGKQRAILTSGTYRLNTELFTVITSDNAKKHGIKPERLKVYTVEADKIGIVTTFDGKSLSSGSIAAPIVSGHDKFQNAQKFIDAGGYRGLQEEILEEGSWNLNPWFVRVEQISLTNIKAGTVGVVISNIGKEIEPEDHKRDRSGFNITPKGYKGIEKIPLEAGKHPINTRVKSIEIVPAHEITLDWTSINKPATNYDSNLKTLMLRSKDGFSFQLQVTQVINIAPDDAPKLISRVGSPAVNKFIQAVEKLETFGQFSEDAVKYSSVQNLVTRVLEPMIGNYFRNSAQDYDALDFLEQRNEIQEAATEHIKAALNAYGVQAVGTFINEVDLPDELEDRVKAQKIAEVERAYLIEEQETEKERQKLES